MKIGTGLAAALLTVTAACVSQGSSTSAKAGALVIVGGGGTTAPIVARALELARGPETIVVVFPQASESKERGVDSAQMWREAGAREALVVEFTDPAWARAQIERADLIWFGGGDQSVLMKDLAAAGFVELVRARHDAGAVCGGTSAGAAVMTAVMITGEGGENLLTSITPGSTATALGLGLLPGAIVDQHFVKRQRANRLISAVLDHPELVGFGIDERTALIVHDGRGEVLGEGPVLVVDARRAGVEPKIDGLPSAAQGMTLHVLRSGSTYDFRR